MIHNTSVRNAELFAVLENLAQWRKLRKTLAGSVGFVPTMGALHAGHTSLLQRSAEENDVTVLSIYVNPTQFNNAEDLDHYPVSLAEDLAKAQDVGVDYVLVPQYDEIYADGFRFQIDETEFSRSLCGASRPGHFSGVLTVVMKLLNAVQPQRAYFGEKDYQQYVLIRDMCAAFFMDVEIVPCVTVREDDGLAMSSRNARLSPQGRHLARLFSETLLSESSDAQVAQELVRLGLQVDYVETREERRFGAVVVDCGSHEVRLIDNVPRASNQ